MLKVQRPVYLAGILLVALFSLAEAKESALVTSPRSVASLITDTDAAAPGRPFTIALRLRLAPGWHTYWLNAGDAGTAPELSLDLPAGTTAGHIDWPAPQRVKEGDLTTYSYTGDVVLPLGVNPGTAPLTLAGHANWLACRDICVPEQGDFSVHLDGALPSPSPQAELIRSALAKVPAPAAFHSTISPDGILAITGLSNPQSVSVGEFMPLGDGVVERAGPQPVRRQGDTVSLRLSLEPSVNLKGGLAGVLRLIGRDGSVNTFNVSAAPAMASVSASAASDGSVLLLLVAALAGGFLLNLMPCVFPVLAMKAMALSRMSAHDRRGIRAEGLSYTAGVVTTFVALGAVLIALRQAGQAVGWGFQLQSPVFVTGVAWLLFTTALNMSDVFSLSGRLVGSGQALASQPGHMGSFFTGLLAVVVATPCTASFMGAAVAGALAAPVPVALSIFAVMGLGLALPYTLIAAVPRVARMLPKPGRWMEVARQALAFPLYASVAWLLWVVSQQSGSSGVLIAAIGLVGIGFAAWALGVAQASAAKGRRIGRAAAFAAVLGSIALLLSGPGSAAEPSEPFSAARLAELRSQGRPVFVNMTAGWCISCLVNERFALSPQPVRDAFARAHVVYLKGDWTKQDPAISAFLQEHGRNGVPLYLFYPPGQQPDVLPQILGEATLLREVAKLGD